MSNELKQQHIKHLKELDDILNYISSKENQITNNEQYFKELSPGKYELIPNNNDKYHLAYEYLTSENFISKDNRGELQNIEINGEGDEPNLVLRTRNSDQRFKENS